MPGRDAKPGPPGGPESRPVAERERWRFTAAPAGNDSGDDSGAAGGGSSFRSDPDRLAVEEPLEIRLRAGGEERVVAVTMRTPGHDPELALGFLAAEGVIASPDEVREVRLPEDPWGAPGAASNVVVVELAGESLPDIAQLERHFFTTSACGVCGKAGIETLRAAGMEAPRPLPGEAAWVRPRALLELPEALRRAQGVFSATGGLHAAALFRPDATLVELREDVGRHNALDKLLGWSFRERRLPLAGHLVLVSGRASYELVQKALAGGAPVLAAVSAPSSLAVDLAREMGLTLVGFLRPGRFNVYSHPERILA